jgi:hypothetical protein
LSQPARRALAAAGYTHLEQLAAIPPAVLLQLHGLGPKAIVSLRRDLAALGLALGAEERAKSKP